MHSPQLPVGNFLKSAAGIRGVPGVGIWSQGNLTRQLNPLENGQDLFKPPAHKLEMIRSGSMEGVRATPYTLTSEKAVINELDLFWCRLQDLGSHVEKVVGQGGIEF